MVDVSPPFAGLLGMVPAAPAFIMPEVEGSQVDVSESSVAQPLWDVQQVWAEGPSLECAAVCEIICAYDWPCETMIRIMNCESKGDPAAYNPAGPYYGWFQIDYEFEGWDNPAVNTATAYHSKYLPALARGDGLSPWPHCRWN